jgi:hypothetical protein
VRQDYSKEQQFWAWFKQREEMLFNFERDRQRIFDELDSALATVSPHLTFEFGPVKNGARDFVISAGGIKSEFAAVEALAAAAPALPQWKVVKLRQRQMPILEMTFAGKTVKPGDVEFCLVSNGRELGVFLFFDAYSEKEADKWRHIGFLLLDQALGEYDVATKVGPIKVLHSSAHPDAVRYALPELPERFDTRFSALGRRH